MCPRLNSSVVKLWYCVICILYIKRGIWTKCCLVNNVAVLLRLTSRFTAWCSWMIHIFPNGLLGAPWFYTRHLKQLLSPLKTIALTFTLSLCLHSSEATYILHPKSAWAFMDFLKSVFQKIIISCVGDKPKGE